MVTEKTLVRGGYVLSMDPRVGELPEADILVENDTIARIAPRIDADAPVIDARGCVVMPGLVDTHRHTWQALVRGRYHDSAFLPFLVDVRDRIAPRYTAEDVYLANRLGAWEALDAGVTTLVDYCHCINTPEHADAAVAGLRDAAIRAVFCYGMVSSQSTGFDSHAHRLADAARVASTYASSDTGLVTMGMAVAEPGLVPWQTLGTQIETARDLHAVVITHTGCVAGTPSGVRQLHRAGLLGPEQIHVHCTVLDDQEWRLLADRGVKVSFSPETELQLVGEPPIGACLAVDIAPTLSCDTAAFNAGDLLTQVRLGLQVQRCRDNDEATRHHGRIPLSLALSTRDALAWVTRNGAEACGLGSRIGSLTPGKQADIIIVGGDTPNLVPRPDPVGAIISQAQSANVRTVLVAGRVLKREGRLVGVTIDRAAVETASARVVGPPAEAITPFPAERFEALRAHIAANLPAAAAQS